jgi:hypothetical protein
VARARPTGRRSPYGLGRRRPQRSPDREKSRQRRRLLGGSGALPPGIRVRFTEGERAVLYVVGCEVKRQGICDWPIDKIAALAGVCRTTVQNALRWAERISLLTIQVREMGGGRKNLTNIVRIVSPEWKAWLARGRFDGFKTMNPTKSIAIASSLRVDMVSAKEADRGRQAERWRRSSA